MHLIDYFQLRITTFHFWLEKTSRDFGVEDLHKLRVEIKKLRAFLRFIEEEGDVGFDRAGHFKLLSTIFKPGGRLRETQMNQSLLKRHRSANLPDFKSYLDRRHDKQASRLAASLSALDLTALQALDEKLMDRLQHVREDEAIHRARSFIRQELSRIRKLKHTMHDPHDLHQMRTHTKAMGYIVRLLVEIKPSQKLENMLLSAKSAESLIGNWHDRVVFRNTLIRFLAKNPESPDRKGIEKLLSQIAYRNGRSVPIIAERLERFIHFRIS